MFSFYLNNTIQDQSREPITTLWDKKPPHMQKTSPANSNPPAETLEPAPFIRSRACIPTACYRFKTSDLINDSMRICKGVSVHPLHFNPFGWTRYDLTALTAYNEFVITRGNLKLTSFILFFIYRCIPQLFI